MELTEVTRQKDADQQRAQAEREHMRFRPRIENADVRDQQIRNYKVEEAPNHVHRCRGEPSAGRLGKGALKRASRRARDKVWDGIRRKNSPKEIRHKPKPIHGANHPPGA